MPCTIEHKDDHVAVMTMNTNKLNAQGPAFFEDLHAAFDHLVATARSFSGIGAVFSAGLDFDQGGRRGNRGIWTVEDYEAW